MEQVSMIPTETALLYMLLVAALGVASSVIVAIIQSRSEARRERVRLAMQAAIEDKRIAVDVAKEYVKKHGRPARIFPLSASIHYHAKILKLIEKEILTPENIRKLNEESNKVTEVIKGRSKEVLYP